MGYPIAIPPPGGFPLGLRTSGFGFASDFGLPAGRFSGSFALPVKRRTRRPAGGLPFGGGASTLPGMYWMIGGDGREYGPVAEEQLREWIAEHRANGQTQVRREAESEWKPLANLTEFAEALRGAATHHAPPPPPPPLASAIPTGASPMGGAPGRLEVGGCLGRAWSLMLGNFGLIGGACAAVWGLLFIARLAFCIGPIISAILMGPLMVGLSLVVLKRARNQPAQIRDVFACFGPAFVQCMLLGIVYLVGTSLGTLLCIIPGLILMVIWAFAYVAAADRPGNFWQAMETSRHAVLPRFVAVACLLVLAWLPMIVISIYIGTLSGSYFSELFLSGGAFDFDTAKLEQFGRYAGGLELKRTIVELINLPFAVAVTVQAYEDIFGQRPGPDPR